MGLRIRKSIKLLPGVKINLSKTGTSVSLGGRGMSYNISKKGRRTTVGLPGSGVSYSTYTPNKAANDEASATTKSVAWVWPLVVLAVIAITAYYNL